MKFEDHRLFKFYVQQDKLAKKYEYKSGVRRDDVDCFIHRLNVADRLNAKDRVKYLEIRQTLDDVFHFILNDLNPELV